MRANVLDGGFRRTDVCRSSGRRFERRIGLRRVPVQDRSTLHRTQSSRRQKWGKTFE